MACVAHGILGMLATSVEDHSNDPRHEDKRDDNKKEEPKRPVSKGDQDGEQCWDDGPRKPGWRDTQDSKEGGEMHNHLEEIPEGEEEGSRVAACNHILENMSEVEEGGVLPSLEHVCKIAEANKLSITLLHKNCEGSPDMFS